MRFNSLDPKPFHLYAPDHRWRTILEHVDKNQVPKPMLTDDPLVRSAYRFLLRWGKAAEADLPGIHKRFPTIMTAFQIYRNPDETKWVLEGGLVAGASDKELAEYFGLPQKVVEVYSRLFFDIREHMKHEGWALTQLLPGAAIYGVAFNDRDLKYKLAGYLWGWDTLKEFLSPKPMSAKGLGLLKTLFLDRLSRLALAAAQHVTVNDQNAAALALGLAREIQTLGAEMGAGNGTDPASKELIDNLIASCKMTLIKSTDSVPAKEPRVFNPDEGFIVRMDPLPVKRLGVE